jgi:4-alpha-glucanotransferase
MLVSAGLLPSTSGVSDADIVLALHGALAASPSRMVAASMYDVLGEVRQPNLPGTVDQYPNWRIPLPASLADIEADPMVRRVAELLSAARPRRSARGRKR